MTDKINQPGVFTAENLYFILRKHILSCAPFPLKNVNVVDVINNFMGDKNNQFIMTERVPIKYSGTLAEFVIANKEAERESELPTGSSIWFCYQFSRLENLDDVSRFKKSMETMLVWMCELGYVVGNVKTGYLGTHKLIDTPVLQLNR